MQDSVHDMKILKPNIASVVGIDGDANACRITIEPFERSYGHTIGNSLRRVLLSSIMGTAVVGVKIKNVSHEFVAIDGLLEDVVDLIINIKGLAFKFYSKTYLDTAIVKLSTNQSSVLTAKNLSLPHNVEIINTDHYICTINKNIDFEVEIMVANGSGYVIETDKVYNFDSVNGWIAVDASFSPVLRVSFNVESTRVDQRVDLDKLVLDIKTNGSIDGKDAVITAANILITQMETISQLDDLLSVTSSQNKDNTIGENFIRNEPSLFDEMVDDLGLSVKTVNALKKMDIISLGDIVKCTEKEIASDPHMGKKSMDEIKDLLIRRELEFSANLD